MNTDSRDWGKDLDEAARTALSQGLAASAPLAPLGVCSSVAVTSQNRVVSTARGTEVVSDPTNVLALERARRLRENPKALIKLATSHRCTRAQAVPDKPGFAAHFRIFCLTSAAHERHGGAFDWLRTLGANNKLAFVASAMGSQLAAHAFRGR